MSSRHLGWQEIRNPYKQTLKVVPKWRYKILGSRRIKCIYLQKSLWKWKNCLCWQYTHQEWPRPYKTLEFLIQETLQATCLFEAVGIHHHGPTSIRNLPEHLLHSPFGCILQCLCAKYEVKSLPPYQSRKAQSPESSRCWTIECWYEALFQGYNPNVKTIWQYCFPVDRKEKPSWVWWKLFYLRPCNTKIRLTSNLTEYE